jgi:hypothetical protein
VVKECALDVPLVGDLPFDDDIWIQILVVKGLGQVIIFACDDVKYLCCIGFLDSLPFLFLALFLHTI